MNLASRNIERSRLIMAWLFWNRFLFNKNEWDYWQAEIRKM